MVIIDSRLGDVKWDEVPFTH